MGVWDHNEKKKKQTTICVSEGQERKRTAQKKLLEKKSEYNFPDWPKTNKFGKFQAEQIQTG